MTETNCYYARIVDADPPVWTFYGTPPNMLTPSGMPIFAGGDELTLRVVGRPGPYTLTITAIQDMPLVPFASQSLLISDYNPDDPVGGTLKLADTSNYIQWQFGITLPPTSDNGGKTIDPEFQVGPGSAPP